MLDKKDGEYKLLVDNEVLVYTLFIDNKELKDIIVNENVSRDIANLIISKNPKIKAKINKGNKVYEARKKISSVRNKIKLSKEELIKIAILHHLEKDLYLEDKDYSVLKPLEEQIRFFADNIAKSSVPYDARDYLANDKHYPYIKEKLQLLINYLYSLEKEVASDELLQKIRSIRMTLINEYKSLDLTVASAIKRVKEDTQHKNINRLSEAISTKMLKEYNIYLDIFDLDISIMEIIDSLPDYIVNLAAMSITVGERTSLLNNIYNIFNEVCPYMYSEEEIKKAILIKYRENSLLKKEQVKGTSL